MGSQKRLAQSAPARRMFYVVVSAGRNYNRDAARRLIFSVAPRSSRAAVSVRTACETEKAIRLELGGSPAAKLFYTQFRLVPG